MSDVVWVGLLSLGGAVLSSVLTNFFNARSTARQLAHSESQSQVQWQRSEATRTAKEARDDILRKEAQARENALRKEERQAAHLRECWGHVLTTRIQIQKMLRHSRKQEEVPLDEWPTVSSGHACTVALLGLPEIYWLVKELHEATVSMEVIAVSAGVLPMGAGWRAWDTSFIALEKAVMLLLGVTPAVEGTDPDTVIRATSQAAADALDALTRRQ